MSTTFERLTLADNDGAPWPADVYRTALRAAYAEIDRLRANALDWTTVTDDPGTLPEYYKDVLVVSMGSNFTAFRDDEMWAVPHITGKTKRVRLERCTMTPIAPGDRWAYIPEVQS